MVATTTITATVSVMAVVAAAAAAWASVCRLATTTFVYMSASSQLAIGSITICANLLLRGINNGSNNNNSSTDGGSQAYLFTLWACSHSLIRLLSPVSTVFCFHNRHWQSPFTRWHCSFSLHTFIHTFYIITRQSSSTDLPKRNRKTNQHRHRSFTRTSSPATYRQTLTNQPSPAATVLCNRFSPIVSKLSSNSTSEIAFVFIVLIESRLQFCESLSFVLFSFDCV